MKLHLKYIVTLVITALVCIFAYQTYWLVGLYQSQVEVDRIFRQFPLESVFIHELKYKEDISALTDEEIRILTMLMDDKKILRMSYGVLLNNKIHVTRGPLVNMDDYIIKYDKHNRLATLNLNFLNQIWKVGVTLIE